MGPEEKGHTHTDLFGNADRAFPPPHRNPACCHEVKSKRCDEHVHELVGKCDSKIAGEQCHDCHRSEEDISGRTMDPPALRSDRSDCAGGKRQHPAANMKDKRELGQFGRQRTGHGYLPHICIRRMAATIILRLIADADAGSCELAQITPMLITFGKCRLPSTIMDSTAYRPSRI
jgi:hypothetical protein